MGKRRRQRFDHLDSSDWNHLSRRVERNKKRVQFRNGFVLFGLVLGLPVAVMLVCAWMVGR